VEVLVHTSADVVRRAVNRWGAVEEVDAGSCRMTMEVDDLAWPMVVLAELDADFVVEGPVELRDRVADVSRRFARAGG
jgi:predicted DNA-binding transcriptional regulator YafY